MATKLPPRTLLTAKSAPFKVEQTSIGQRRNLSPISSMYLYKYKN